MKGIRPDGPVEVLDAKWHGANTLELTYKAQDGKPGCELLFRDREPSLEIASLGPAFNFDAPGGDPRRLLSLRATARAHLGAARRPRGDQEEARSSKSVCF